MQLTLPVRSRGAARAPRFRSTLCALALFAAGCGGPPAEPLYPVRGTVTAGGRPVPNGDVVFVPVEAAAGAPLPRGRIEPNGAYTVRTADRDGAPAGQYRVAVVIDDTKEVKAPIDPKVGSTDLTPLTVEVSADRPAGAYDLKIDPRPTK